jgi:hypothetical protein
MPLVHFFSGQGGDGSGALQSKVVDGFLGSLQSKVVNGFGSFHFRSK